MWQPTKAERLSDAERRRRVDALGERIQNAQAEYEQLQLDCEHKPVIVTQCTARHRECSVCGKYLGFLSKR
jgi:hypothetical protein